MKRIVLIIGISALTLGGGFAAFVATAGANGSVAKTTATSAAKALVGNTGKSADFALFDGTGADVTTQCHTTTHQRFTVYLSFRAVTADAILRVTFADADFVDYPIPVDTSFSFSQTAGTTHGVDNSITVSEESGVGNLVGWISAAHIPGSLGLVSCATTAN